MKLDTFNRLPLDQKTSYMWDHGVCLAQRIIENRYILCIFEVNGFFVEAIYSRRNNRVNAILPIADIPEWEGYVDQVLTNLLKLNELSVKDGVARRIERFPLDPHLHRRWDPFFAQGLHQRRHLHAKSRARPPHQAVLPHGGP